MQIFVDNTRIYYLSISIEIDMYLRIHIRGETDR